MQNKEKNYLPYVINLLNILLYDIFRVKLTVYSKRSVYLSCFCYYTHIKISMVTFCLLIQYVKRLDIRTHYLL